ncbi:hypothetical protein SERLADRAFT_379873 [Serpula lacrymans var. lacrymans S7.9]|uniref:Uncharacterized protein n=1 Tax=Serpula lacrymans var. lacrymans (strain S7.9) TaxID=578457 RepID=F8NJM0_SERL9|nr:uncharacterized protein SERLADRAFT_379873 [Serpula lacrymans var. lacrymans S7.9]EGO28235.1 hypothetical protein SERLADRAFT_379873 [Serpula lacrymans var. lacrymans S7.9]
MLPMTPHQLTILTVTFSYTKSRRALWLITPCTLSQSVFKGLSKNASLDHLPPGMGVFSLHHQLHKLSLCRLGHSNNSGNQH